MRQGIYSYMAYKNQHNGIHIAIRVVHYSTLESCRKDAKEKGLSDKNGDVILRYHEYRGLEDKEYKIN